jgi:hypothetical protein
MSQRDCTQCSAMTKKGTRCTRKTCKYADMCYQHTKSNKNLEIKKSGIKQGGQGLFTTKKISKNQNVASYGGKVVSKQQYNASNSSYGIQINKDQILDGSSTQSGLGRYANSCRRANRDKGDCKGNNGKLVVNKQKKTARIKATKTIAKGSEVFVPYGFSFWK